MVTSPLGDHSRPCLNLAFESERALIVQELCESRGVRPGLSVLTSLLVSGIEPCFGIGHNLSLICQVTSEDIKHQLTTSGPTPQELCESRGGRPGLRVPNSSYGL